MTNLPAGFHFYLHFLEAQSAYSTRIDALPAMHATTRWELGTAMIDAIGRLKNCHETCNGHDAWACFEVQSRTWEGMRTEVESTIAKVERILTRYTRGAVTKVDR